MSTMDVGKKLVEFCKNGKIMEAIDSLYAPNIVSLEAMEGGPEHPARIEGLAKVKAKSEWWMKNHEVHSADVKGPWPNGDRFAVYFHYDVTAKGGPMAGKRFKMEEVAMYTVKGAKIVHEEFFYSM